eukprot:CAMPEP_0114352860 /NCGR_PEP_ID=MMETSP0101-20121206/18246_1 /TAXON_ID=38822 ORGANISM="Pteridomonas danica, Strain PT" /NCGR_SAMPLE_ID=MMETSP0101 /ASSEMBLY_ACC=CAM_ASM_000211 /LENGTH=203 /DNA_ID=CAMNT_0001493439 /DNA_START=41 /DNA_END=652 /DNA_ORIENTATION=-
MAESIVQTSGGITGAGAGGGLGLNAPGAGPKVQSFAGGPATKGVNIDATLESTWQDILNESHETTWFVAEYSEDGKTVEMKNSGTGGLAAFKENLGDALAWGGFKCIAVDNRENTTSKRSKFVFVQYMPQAGPAMRKAKMGSHKGTLKSICTGAHLDIMIDNVEEITEDDLVKRLQAATGAHKPNGYEFEPGVVTSAEGFLNG